MRARAIAIGRAAEAGPVVGTLRRNGVEVVQRRSAADALTEVAADCPDLLVVGADVPDAITWVRAARTHRCTAPVLLLGAGPQLVSSSEDLVGLGVVLLVDEDVPAPARSRVVVLSVDPALRAFLRLALRETFEVIVQASPSRVLELMQAHAADAYLLDEDALAPEDARRVPRSLADAIVVIRRGADDHDLSATPGTSLRRPFSTTELRAALSRVRRP